MRKESFAFLKRLMTTPSPSGFEQAAQEVCREYIAPYVDKVYKDVHGNQFAVRNVEAGLRVMLDAHIDEVGLMVKHIDDKGFISFVSIGSVDPSILGCQRVKVLGAKGPVAGVIGRKPPHVTEEDERGKALKMHELWIDIAAKSKKDAAKYVDVGDPIVVDVPFIEMANGSVCARGFDDRMGAFVILEAMRLIADRDIDCAVYCVTAVQEEIGCRGARTAAYGVNPAVALAVEFGWSTDHPSMDVKQFGERRIGKGPLISRGPNINPMIEKQLRSVAEKKKIPYQIVPEPRGTPTDANPIQLTRDRADPRAGPVYSFAGGGHALARRGVRRETYRGVDRHAQARHGFHPLGRGASRQEGVPVDIVDDVDVVDNRPEAGADGPRLRGECLVVVEVFWVFVLMVCLVASTAGIRIII